ncbi:SusC/RagA family TonB-linked outer membrane protein [Spirosoma utsteinense]|uniref:Iron complex outermembrane receptor protein n=1 Tax=Spirosoma utsteinense TaxID=2585773 RepID=A0ABR6W7A7_9BACT|nr:SusC/RagA family TonB-linked outer membrane protein [Spirosoma utsteinense]MBC3784889.1 iron complex outermembrane receptor protein [Spirosoma utsteinense]MBC3792450.1 iron complex outermembrane receptor protein [Spirosoma utsteinense]
MMDKSYKSSRFSGCVGLVGQSQPQSFVQRAFFSFLTMLVMVVLLSSQTAWAQERTVTGKVTDATGSVLPGVSIQVKGTTRGANTNADGVYTLTVGDNATLVFSFIGYTSQEVVVGNRSTVDVQLADDTKALQEVVVVGYGTQKAKDVTGSVATLGTKDFNKGVISSPEQLLQGRVAGVQITPASGEPGAANNIQIRGAVSLRGGNTPLYVIDGVPLDGGDFSSGTPDFGTGTTTARNPLSFLNPSDIENISVLKDASAAAIYGARGANGVVLITTRKGRAGAPQFNFSASAAVSSSLKRYDLLSASDFLAGVTKAGGDATLSTVNAGADVNWQDQILRTSVSQIYNASFGGGSNDTRYLFSLGYQDQQGLVKNTGQQRVTGRINASQDLFNKKVNLAVNATTSSVSDQYALTGNQAGALGNLFGAMIGANPTYPVFTNSSDTASYYQLAGGSYRNPRAMLDYYHDRGVTNRTLANLSATWNILEGLSLKANFGVDNSTSTRTTSIDSRLNGQFSVPLGSVTNQVYADATTGLGGAAYINSLNRLSKLVEYTANYNRTLGSGVLDAVVGFAYQTFGTRTNYVAASRFPFNESSISYPDNIGAANTLTGTAIGGGSSRNQNDLQSFFGRANYNFKEKYLLTATVRVDGSSRFGVNNKYGTFPSVAAAWRISQEDFMPKGIFDDLKLRANYGIVGNQDFTGGASKIIYTYNNTGAQIRQNNPNPDLKWEQNTTTGAGIDFSVAKGRLSGSIDYYNRAGTNTLLQVFYAQPAPVNYRWINLPGQIVSRGIELNLIYQVFQKASFGWESVFNLTTLNIKAQNIGTNQAVGAISGQGLSGAYAERITDGYPPFAFFIPKFTGFDANGFSTYADDGRPTYQGSPFAKLRLGLTNNFTFGQWTASLFVNGQFGGKIYNNTANALFAKGALKNARNVTYEVANSNENGLNPASVSTRFLEKSDYVRITNLTLSRRFDLPQGGFAKSLSLSLTGQNLFIFTGYTGLNPDVNTVTYNGNGNGIPSLGIDYTPYPTPRTVTLGLNVGF